jgi:cyanophycin synthetase
VLGVDLIVSDPAAAIDPDRDAIIEVNPAPGFAQHERTQNGKRRNLAGAILDHLFPGGANAARIPVVAGPIGCGLELERIGHWLYERGVHPVGFTRNTSWSGIPRRKMGYGPQSASLLLLDAQAEVLLIEVDEVLASETGIPVDCIDFLIANRRTDPLALMLARLHNSKRKGKVRVEDVLRACKTPSSGSPGK